MLWSLSVNSFAALIHTIYLTDGFSFTATQTYESGSTGNSSVVPVSLPFGLRCYNHVSYTVPDGCTKAIVNIYGLSTVAVRSVVGSGGINVSSTTYSVSGPGLSGSTVVGLNYGDSHNAYIDGSFVVDVVPGSVFSLTDYYLTASCSCSASGSINAVFYFTFQGITDSPSDNFISFYSGSDVTVSDLDNQTSELTQGFDSSQGDQVADQLGQEMDNYLQTEDALYDQMQYDVPEIDLVNDSQGILLASNFLQSLYVSDSFISKCITFVLSFGLILFIVGWLKKRGSG